MSLVLNVAIGYVVGRLIVHFASIVAKVVIEMALQRSPRLRAMVRSDLVEEARLRESLGVPSSLRR